MYEKRPKTAYDWLTSFNMCDRILKDPIMPPATVQMHYRHLLKSPKMTFAPQPWQAWNQLHRLGEKVSA